MFPLCKGFKISSLLTYKYYTSIVLVLFSFENTTMNTRKQALQRFMIYIDRDLLEKLRMVSQKYSRSVNGQIVWTLKQLIEQEEKMFQKTNKKWHPYKDMGSYYKLENGTLYSADMEKNGNIAMVDGQVNAGEVDWDLIEGEYLDKNKKILITDLLNEIVKELTGKD